MRVPKVFEEYLKRKKRDLLALQTHLQKLKKKNKLLTVEVGLEMQQAQDSKEKRDGLELENQRLVAKLVQLRKFDHALKSMAPKQDEGDKTQRVEMKKDLEQIQALERGIVRGFSHSKSLHQ